VLDGESYASAARFYYALKIPEGELRRASASSALSSSDLRALVRRHGASFTYQGAEIEVGSVEHLQLAARATEAKMAAHGAAREALRKTGHALQYMGSPQSQPLGRAMPFALMVERYHK
jgi:hypothetical protein